MRRTKEADKEAFDNCQPNNPGGINGSYRCFGGCGLGTMGLKGMDGYACRLDAALGTEDDGWSQRRWIAEL